MSDNTKILLVKVGRSPSNDIVINIPNVSSKHAVFKISQDKIILEDAGSTNGTFVNGEQITSKVIGETDKISFSKQHTFELKKLEPFVNRFRSDDSQQKISSEERLHSKLLQEKNLITIGRSNDNDLILNNIKVSRKHAKLEKIGNE
jgi:pSer/pThr/pTyr-binding forkhead associated (FHA) protein